ncbi:uncharacterized protein NEMAJ01_1405 [Nematocida major]|uniref:uncharacterized protein n=1 Tax=Nematocida major TaxID=1912982 RepID=UPI00200789A2|nr:uncharacterized protein NEMAJ01_1405 [Nematocida major]KAH9386509.1 hypothetical protein NEMAJ01_1405 [Nematocida major]
MKLDSFCKLTKKAEYVDVLYKLSHMNRTTPIPVRRILDLYREGMLPGGLNYYRAILKKRNIVCVSIRESLHRIMSEGGSTQIDITEYRELYRANLFTDKEMLEIMKEVSKAHPNEMYRALECTNSFAKELLRLISTAYSESVCVIARAMLEENVGCLLEYINSTHKSKILKYLVKDNEGIEYLKKNVLASLTHSVSTVEDMREMIDQTITLHIALCKIDFTLVLLAPVIGYIKKDLSAKLESFGCDLAAEALFSVVSQRACDVIKNAEEIGKECENTKFQLQGDVLDFLLSLLPYDSLIQTLALSISRDCILARSNRNKLIRILEDKLGFYRTSSIGIIKKDFQYFSSTQVPEKQIYRDVVSGTCIPEELFSQGGLGMEHFVVSEHYWPESSHQSWEDLMTAQDVPSSIQKMHGAAPKKLDEVSLEYTNKHTYLDITVEQHGTSVDISVPIQYVEYLYSTKNMSEQEVCVIREFWAELEKTAQRKQCN